MRVAGLFAGIGGLELGLHRAGHQTIVLAENFPSASAVLEARFPDVPLAGDVRELRNLPSEVEVLAAGFPCQDLSSVGRKEGIAGDRSRLVAEVFRLAERRRVPWLVLENVPFLLQLGRGRALALIARELERLGYAWAYRVVDTEAFGLPQRRRRWYLVASTVADPRDVLLAADVERPAAPPHEEVACGFYWTEGMRALGWAVDALPPIKGGSSIGVPSPPAIRLPDGTIVTPDLRDAERLQGFPADWTSPAERVGRRGFRWQLVGNAVSVPVAEWLGRRLQQPLSYDPADDPVLVEGAPWPYAAWAGFDGQVHTSKAGPWPLWRKRSSLLEFLRYPTQPLSARAAAGFLRRTAKGSLRFPDRFLEDVRLHVETQLRDAA